MSLALRNKALGLLHGDPAILDVAREVTRVMADAHIDGAIIGGVAVVLHGHLRTTRDVDVYAPDLDKLAAALRVAGFEWDDRRHEFLRDGVPVHLVSGEHVTHPPRETVVADGIRIAALPDLLNLKLRTGTQHVLRAQDLADAIGLIRHHRLGNAFAAQIDGDLRAEFRNLVKAIKADGR